MALDLMPILSPSGSIDNDSDIGAGASGKFPMLLLANVLKKRRKKMRAHKHRKLLRRRRHKSIHNKNK